MTNKQMTAQEQIAMLRDALQTCTESYSNRYSGWIKYFDSRKISAALADTNQLPEAEADDLTEFRSYGRSSNPTHPANALNKLIVGAQPEAEVCERMERALMGLLECKKYEEVYGEGTANWEPWWELARAALPQLGDTR